ncbi:hypothetical protein SLEP1_g30424 [Rubroshorea leprosula]|uniref:PGG domain-containing protein n=1 Tax=Rubroshorea leprosula TaxID=152421 RepID=A0AAV5K5P3_9ROSI|nr:hypothetical protein SLEP1_g30424 [Rubroshorea leprosula]
MLCPTVEAKNTDAIALQSLLTELQSVLRKVICNGSKRELDRFFSFFPEARSYQVMLKSALHVAITAGQEDIACFLYRETPSEFLRGDYGFILLEECITKKMFKIALDLLVRFPELATNKPPQGYMPIILTLAKTPPLFFRGSQLKFVRLWIYRCIVVNVDLIRPSDAAHGDSRQGPSRYRQSCLQFLKALLRKWVTTLLKILAVELFSFPETRSASTFYLFFFLGLLGDDNDDGGDGDDGDGKQRDLWFCPSPSISVVIEDGDGGGGCDDGLDLQKGEESREKKRWVLGELNLAKQIYDLKSRDVYAGEVVSFLCQKLRDLEHNQFVQGRAVAAIFLAIKNGNPELAIEIARAKEDILWTSIDPEDSRTIFAYAIAHRQEEVAKFLYGYQADKFYDTGEMAAFLNGYKADKFYDKFYDTDERGNNNLHLAAKLAPHFQLDRISDAASQLQSEVRWYKSVEGILPRFYNEQKNKDGETPYQMFVKEHKNMLKEAEAWMKKTAESCTVIGALIITIMFGAAFTVPGGNDQNTGFPIFLNTTAPVESFTVTPFKVFIISDAISLFTAASSVLIFLGILTARYAYEDFLISLPMKLIFGLSFLFISIATMTVAFCATLYVMLRGQQKEVIPITVLAGILIICLVLMQLPLLLNNMALTPRPNIFDRKTAIAQLFEFLARKIPIVPSVVKVVVTKLIRRI